MFSSRIVFTDFVLQKQKRHKLLSPSFNSLNRLKNMIGSSTEFNIVAIAGSMRSEYAGVWTTAYFMKTIGIGVQQIMKLITVSNKVTVSLTSSSWILHEFSAIMLDRFLL